MCWCQTGGIDRIPPRPEEPAVDLISRFQDLVAQLPEVLQPLVVALAGAVPFIEGEGAASIGIVGGVHPVVAVIAGALGNFICVAVLVLLGSRARSAIVDRSRSKAARTRAALTADEQVGAAALARASSGAAVHEGPRMPEPDAHLDTTPPAPLPAAVPAAPEPDTAELDAARPQPSARTAARRAKFQRALDRYGVPGVSLLGPLLLPTQFTSTMLAAAGVSVRRVLFWQGLAIAAWTTLLGVVVGGVVHSVA
jgi:hypothetical protein